MLSPIDTDVMIDLSRGNVDAANYLDSLNDPAISLDRHYSGTDRWGKGQVRSACDRFARIGVSGDAH